MFLQEKNERKMELWGHNFSLELGRRVKEFLNLNLREKYRHHHLSEITWLSVIVRERQNKIKRLFTLTQIL